MQKNKVLVTGANGFVGKHLLYELQKKKIPAFGLVRTKEAADEISSLCEGVIIETLEAVVENSEALCGFDTVIHLAARVHQMSDRINCDEEEYLRVNKTLTLQLAESSIKAGVSNFLFGSTVKVVGDDRVREIINESKMGTAVSENDACCPDEPYGKSKYEAEKALRELFREQEKSRCVLLRFPIMYGPENKGNMLTLMKAASKKLRLPLGGVKGKRSMAFIGNISDAIVTILNDEAKRAPVVSLFFLNDGVNVTSKELYDAIMREMTGNKGAFYFPPFLLKLSGNVGSLIEKITGKRFPINNDVLKRLFEPYVFSSKHFMTFYNWKPPYTFEEGIKSTVDWFLTEK